MSENDRYALLVGVSVYDHGAYQGLPSVRANLHYMRAVLESTEIGSYDGCAIAAEPTRAEMLHAVGSFLEDRRSGETALLYVSGHGEFCEDDGQLYFLTRDTDPSDLPGTAVAASFLERTLQSCRATSKIALLDCCSRESAAQGRTDGSTGRSALEPTARSTLLRPAGVHFITASDALQDPSAMSPSGSAPGTSRFTGEIVEGLRTGRIEHDGDWITPDDLFEDLASRMAGHGVPEEQRPARAAVHAVARSVPFARPAASPVNLPPPSVVPGDGPDAGAGADVGEGVDWRRLLQYYVHCLGAGTAAGMMPARDTGRDYTYFLVHGAAEAIQSGLAGSLPAPPKLHTGSLQEYWYGYPAVTLPGSDTGGRRRNGMRIAPLLIQPLEFAQDENGDGVLRPTGVPALHTGVVTEMLADDDAADLLARWQPAWQEGDPAQMVRAVRELLDELGLPELEWLESSALDEESARWSLMPGAHNVAVLLTPSGWDRVATEGLVDNLLQISAKTDQIPGTALAALVHGGAHADVQGDAPGADPAAAAHSVVAPGPCNESQERVIASAMTRPLTVAAGPPGTGKSELVTAVVTTAVASGQSVLVASTDNEAVDTVAERCDSVAPGLLMRTGNSEALVAEAAKLERLLAGAPQPPPARGSATVAGDLRAARARADVERDEAGRLVAGEQRLLGLLRKQEHRAEALGIPPRLLARIWTGDGDAARAAEWLESAKSAAEARSLFARSRRRRVLEPLVAALDEAPGPAWHERPGWMSSGPVTSDLLSVLADMLAAELRLRELRREHPARSERQLGQRRRETAALLSSLSDELSRAVSAEALARAHTSMGERLQTLRNKRGNQRSQRNLLQDVRGWAISTHSVRQLELVPELFDLVVIDEASQCSVPSVLPLLFRARRALIIGDPARPGHIPGVSPQQERQARLRTGLSAAQLEDRRLTYHVHSSYDAAARSGAAALLLDEHYRCHPRIADVVNAHCYAGRLQIMTDVRVQVPAADPVGAADPAPALGWVDVPLGTPERGPGGTSWHNEAEAEAVRDLVAKLLTRLPDDARIGVVTPFRAQKEALDRLLPQQRVRVGTVRAFQGGQQDVMVLSPVATTGTPETAVRWAASRVNLWNAAVSRAGSQVITVGDRAFWQGLTGLPALLAHRSAVLRPGMYEDPDGTAAPPPPDAEDPVFRGELADRLQRSLASHGITASERSAVVGGRTVDLLFTADGENTAVLIDTGPPPGLDAARHHRLAHARGELLVGLPSGGRGAKAAPVSRTVRLPAWRILAGQETVGPLLG
ncbi:caspase, EACC1-associated type [Streptomyces winkii]|uniref:caspase, EACC1-associated type n=1 Tax=Streptomyces winkii TaxID=3051178 RepID=UPI0028D63998|nr:AAA domain-containing protein [Streptomyces sp. DSM 40971]